MIAKKKIEFEFWVGDLVYLVTDEEKTPHQVIQILIDIGSVMYKIQYVDAEPFWVYAFQIEDIVPEKNNN